MNTLTEMEAACSRILFLLEHDDLRKSTLVALSGMLANLRSDLQQHLEEWRAADGDSPDLRSAEESMRAVDASMLWLKEYAEVKPLMEVSHKLRMPTVRVLRVVTLLQHAPGARLEHVQSAPLASLGHGGKPYKQSVHPGRCSHAGAQDLAPVDHRGRLPRTSVASR